MGAVKQTVNICVERKQLRERREEKVAVVGASMLIIASSECAVSCQTRRGDDHKTDNALEIGFRSCHWF